MLRSYLDNKAINLLNIHFSLVMMGYSLGELFLVVFLYKQNVPIWAIFLGIAGSYTLRMLIRPISMKLCFRFGLKKIILWGIALCALLYPAFAFVQGINIWFYVFFFLFSVSDVLYWLTYHTLFSVLGDKEKRGEQTGARESLSTITSFLAPLISGFLVISFDYWATFLAAMIVFLASAIPILNIPSSAIQLPINKKSFKKEVEKDGFWLFAGDGFFANHTAIWGFLLFSIVLNPQHFGFLIALSVIAKFLIQLIVGRVFDKGFMGKILYRIGIILLCFSILGRAFITDTVGEVIFFDVVFALGIALFSPILNASLYNLSKSSKHPLWFHFYAEKGCDIGAGVAAIITAMIYYFTGRLEIAMAISILGFFVSDFILKKYFKSRQQEMQVATIEVET